MRMRDFVMDTIFNTGTIAVFLVVLFRTELFFRMLGLGKYDNQRLTPGQIRVFQVLAAVIVLGSMQMQASNLWDFFLK